MLPTLAPAFFANSWMIVVCLYPQNFHQKKKERLRVITPNSIAPLSHVEIFYSVQCFVVQLICHQPHVYLIFKLFFFLLCNYNNVTVNYKILWEKKKKQENHYSWLYLIGPSNKHSSTPSLIYLFYVVFSLDTYLQNWQNFRRNSATIRSYHASDSGIIQFGRSPTRSIHTHSA